MRVAPTRQSPTAVVGGILLQSDAFFWLDVAWQKILEKHGIEPPLHMTEFRPNGRFRDLRHDARRTLFSDLVRAINEHKTATIAATLSTDQYRRHFSELYRQKDFGVYGSCFILLAVLQGKYAQKEGYKDEIPFILDSGNNYRRHVVEAHSFLREHFQPSQFANVGGLAFDTDEKVRALQAADLVSWSVRRRIADKFNNGFETLVDIFNPPHIEQPFEAGWMEDIATRLRALRTQREQS